MKRLSQFLHSAFAQRDWGAMLILGWIVIVMGWSASMVFSTTMRDMALKRFHLTSNSFLCWVVNQSVPSMYNHENRIQFTNQLLGNDSFDVNDETYATKTLNHFPIRYITFGDQVPRCFKMQRQGTLELQSRFSDTTLTTRWEIQERDNGTMIADVISSKIERKARDE